MMEKDLKEVLKRWEIPDPSQQLDERVMETYLRRRRPWRILNWKGFVRVPVPILVLLLFVQLVSAATIVYSHIYTSTLPPVTLSMPERIVEIPVVKEKVVVRTMYLPVQAPKHSSRRISNVQANLGNEKEPMNLTGFQPVSDFQIQVIKGGNRNGR